nr:MAG TPA: hypothetical protein [Caudoviricetes sp.]
MHRIASRSASAYWSSTRFPGHFLSASFWHMSCPTGIVILSW